ncbi:hypothetical protein APHAL10511_002622 [Amanita phalloides]|nr:hypothetical protein APHAL10511_002622 [Amanita phalloides]
MPRPYSTSSGFRGTYNYRPNDRQRYVPRGSPQDPPDNSVFLQGLKATPLESVPIPPTVKRVENLNISETKYLGSYDWTTRATPTILVPGSPAEWLDKKPFRVPPDTGTNIIDHNSYHLKEMPLLPLFAAVDANEDADTFDWSTVDIVTDRNGLRRLLRWISGGEAKPFRIDLQLAGKGTVLMNRWEKEATSPFLGYAYGTNYFNAAAKKLHSESTCHHRIIGYQWNGLNMVVRSTVDAFIPVKQNKSDIDDIVSALSSLNVTQSKPEAATRVKNSSLEVIRLGKEVPQESIVEVATISKARESQLDWQEKGPQLYLSQIPHFYVGLHERGNFSEVRKHKFNYTTLPDQVLEHMKKLRRALAIIQNVVIKHGKRGRLSLVCIDGTLQVYEREDDKSCLPDEFMERFGI